MTTGLNKWTDRKDSLVIYVLQASNTQCGQDIFSLFDFPWCVQIHCEKRRLLEATNIGTWSKKIYGTLSWEKHCKVFTTKFCSTFKSHYHKNYIYFYYFHLSILIILHTVVQFSFLYIKWGYYELRYDNEQKLFVKMFK